MKLKHVAEIYHIDPKILDRLARKNVQTKIRLLPKGAVWTESSLFVIPYKFSALIPVWKILSGYILG